MKHFNRSDRNLLIVQVELYQLMSKPVSSPKLASVRQDVIDTCLDMIWDATQNKF